MQKSSKLELTWVGKYEEKKVEPRILLEDKNLSNTSNDEYTKNMLIHGDNLIALKALEQDFAGKIKCVYIDPPYNTGSAFEHYDDGLEHSLWLSIMRPRIEIIHSLLSDDGSLWISIDDDEQAYLKVLCDEIFGRRNFVSTIVWQKKYGPANDAKWISDSHDFIFVYAKNKEIWRPNLLPRTKEQLKDYKNPDNDPRGLWRASDLSARTYSPSCDYEIIGPTGNRFFPPPTRAWTVSKERFQELVDDNRIWWGVDKSVRPMFKKFLTEVKEGVTPETWWPREVCDDNKVAKYESKDLFIENPFSTPKPERLLQRILTLATKEGEIILDSFLGSGTTAAVAHKMGRKWIGIELGEHAYTHCKVRLDKVVHGEQGGISKIVGWKGGGGYKFYELAPSLLEKHSVLPVYQVNKVYTFEMLCEAICKIESFKYQPEGETHGKSSETRYIHISKDYVNGEYIKKILKVIDENHSVLIYGTKIQSNMRLPDNVEVKRIPKDLLRKFDFESEVR
jgi:adenine-specific DNA-methyltransferase